MLRRDMTNVPGLRFASNQGAKAALMRTGDLDWEDAMALASPEPAVTVPSTHPLYILYTSGTLGAEVERNGLQKLRRSDHKNCTEGN